jgi:SP family general alpha glucoside:H+ symporter-like MFS transporter
MPHFGRRAIFLWGQIVMTAILFAVGGIGIAQNSPNASSDLAWGVGALLMLSSFVANLAISPILYSLVSELPSSLLRSKSVVIARFSYAVVNVIANVITPYQLNPSAWGWGAVSGWFWGGACLLGCIFTYFCVPEPKGRTVAELDLLFRRKVSARKFSSASVQLREMVEAEDVELKQTA